MNADDDALLKIKKGRESEDRFFCLLSPPSKIPEWITLVTRASRRDDTFEGIDFYVITNDDKTIPVDVKSSFAGKRKSHRKKIANEVCIIVIREDFDDDSMREQVIQVLEKWKAKRLL